MRNYRFIIAVVLFFSLCLPASQPANSSWNQNPGITNPIGSSTVPPTSTQSGLISSPNPFDTNGNLVITGNVRYGRHFRGTVPYGSTTSFRASVGSSSLSSFLRDSAGAEDFGNFYGKYAVPAQGRVLSDSYQPYYSPSQTVTTTLPGRAGVFRPESIRTFNGAQDVFGLEFLSRNQALTSQGTAVGADLGWQGLQTQYGPSAEPQLTSLRPRDTGQLVPREINIRQQAERPAFERYREQSRDSRTTLTPQSKQSLSDFLRQGQAADTVQPLDHSQLGQTEDGFQTQRPRTEQTITEEQTAATGYELPTLDQLTTAADPALQENHFLQRGANWSAVREAHTAQQGPDSGQELVKSDLLEQIKQQLDELNRLLDARSQTRQNEAGADKGTSAEMLTKRQATPLTSRQYTPDSSKAASIYEPQGYKPRLGGNEQLWPPTTQSALGLSTNSGLDQLNKFSQAELSAEAKRIMRPHRSLDSFSQAKFIHHMQAAEEFLKAGRYYQAADYFALANIYDSDNPLALAGKGHALFAAGEYISSALFISRALVIAPEYAQTNIDLRAISGGENELASRIADAEQWLARSGSNELRFLLSYVYYRTGRLNQAKQAIDVIYKKTPQSPAVQALKTAIEDKLTIKQ